MNPLMAMSAAGSRTTGVTGGDIGGGGTEVNAYALTAQPIAIRPSAGGLGAGNERELARLRRELEASTLELMHQKKLAGMYLQREYSLFYRMNAMCRFDPLPYALDVNRLYHSAVSARSGEAEQQNLVTRRLG
jgi:hypothetical protein